MKVLERKEVEKEFKYDHTCDRCESRLQVEADDLLYESGGGDQRESWPETFKAICAVCRAVFNVPEARIPKYVKHLTRERNNKLSTTHDR